MDEDGVLTTDQQNERMAKGEEISERKEKDKKFIRNRT